MNPGLSRALAVAALSGLLAAPAGAETLQDALSSAYGSNPRLQSERASLRATDESVPQALSNWRPTVSLGASAGFERADTGVRGEQNLQPRSGTLTVTQPLYRGGRTQSATEEAEATVKAGRAGLLSVEQTVLLDAVTAYMDVLRDQATVQLNKNNEVVLGRQLEATKDRFQVGEVTRTDVAQAEARLSGARASRVAAEGALAISRATYEQVVGHPAGTLEPAPPLPKLPESQEAAMAIALKENPDLAEARYAEAAAGHAVRTAFGSLLPTVSLEGSLTRSDETSLENVNSQEDSLLARVTVPLYQAGAVTSQVRQAKEQRSQRLLQIETAQRTVTENTRQAWEDLQSAHTQIAARKEEVRANRIALDGVRQEAAVGSRTTLDVLDAEQELLNAQVALVGAQRNEYVAGFRLLSAIGRLTAHDLKLPVDYYDPGKHYDEVRNKWWGLTPPEE